ncbi:hypothetical protein B0H13DRAFT_2333370 [Mycena leptocephala]|nr:hypothetical protein B0H13DRAFT_2333370 [Mycena leptocephala]
MFYSDPPATGRRPGSVMCAPDGSGTKDHKKAEKLAADAGKVRQITSFFGGGSSRPRQSSSTAGDSSSAVAGPSSLAVSSSAIIDVDADSLGMDSDINPPPIDSRGILLRRLQVVISTLPSGIPLASASDLLASFAVDPITLVGPGQDAWEDIIHGMFDRLTYEGGRPRNAIEISQIIRRGEMGMDAFAIWLEKCFFALNISAAMVEDRIERIIQGMLLLGATTSAELPSIPTPPPRERSPEPKAVTIPIGCPGQELPLKEGKSSFLSYPITLNAHRDLPWGVEFGQKLIIRSYECKRGAQESGVCHPCEKLLRHPAVKGILERKETGNHPNTTFAYLTMDDALNLLRKKNEQINSLKLAGLTLSQTLLVRATHLAAHSRLQIAVGRGDIPRIHSIVANCRKNGDSIFTCIEKIGRAAGGSFNPKSYSQADHQLLYLLLKLGGHAVAELGHRCLGLPSISTAKRHIATVPLIVSPGAPTAQEMLQNLDTLYPNPHPLHLMVPEDLDEIKVEGRMRWDPRSNKILGAEELHTGLAQNLVHLASEATVAAISSFSDVPVRNIAHPFLVAPTCKREAATDQRILLEAALSAAKAKVAHIGGRPYCFSSDGDNKRRNATILFTFIRELDRNGDLFKKSGDLPLFDYHCGEDDLIGNIDIKHILKRLRNTLIRILASTIDGVVLLQELIKQHLQRDSSHSSHHIDKVLNPNDRQNVKLMYDLLSAIAMLPEAKETDTPTFKNTRRILRLLGCLYRHILEAYTNINLSLHEQLVHISAAMHLMLALYNKEAGRFVPSQTYFDFMTAGKNLFFCVAKTQLEDPDGKFWIIQPGSDPLEKTFGGVRTITASDSNTDMYQLGSRLTAAMECGNILAEHPEWASDPRRLKLPVWHEVAGDVSAKIDHISPRIWVGDTRVKNVSTRTTWMAGKRAAEADLHAAFLEPPFDSMHKTGGFNIFCPFGENKVVLITPPRPDERDEDPDESDLGRAPDFTSGTAPPTFTAADPDAPFLPDIDDMAQGAVSSLDSAAKVHDAYLAIPGSNKQQHKATILRIFSSRFSISESRDRLKRVRAFSRHDVSLNSSNSDELIPGEPAVVVQDPAAIFVRSNGFTWLAVVSISGITCGTKHVDTLPKRLLGEPNVRARVQIMELVPAKNTPRVGSEEGDWEWSGKFVTTAGTSKICEVDGSAIQLLDPAVLPASYSSKNAMPTYHFKSVELVAIAAAMEMRTRSTKKLPEVAFGSTFPYRTSAGFACFVCNKDGSSLLQEEGLCTLCPKATLSVKSAYKLVEHMAIHILFDRNPPLDRNLNLCGFCLGTNCSIVLVKSKGGDGAIRIDMKKSRCPNLANLGLVTAAKSTDRSPCTQRPFTCPVSPCADTVWKYKHQYELAEGEEVALRTISTRKTRSSKKKKKVNFRISEEHSTEAALGEFSQLSDDSDEEGEPEISDSSRSSTPDIDDIIHSPTQLRPLSPDDDLPEPSALFVASQPPTHPIAPSCSDEPPAIVVDQVESAADPICHASDPAPMTTGHDSNTSSGRPKPRRIPKRLADSMESAADDPAPLVTSTDAQ